jgi:hypothetical protein
MMDPKVFKKAGDVWEVTDPRTLKKGDVVRLIWPDRVMETRPATIDGETVYVTEFVLKDDVTQVDGKWYVNFEGIE